MLFEDREWYSETNDLDSIVMVFAVEIVPNVLLHPVMVVW